MSRSKNVFSLSFSLSRSVEFIRTKRKQIRCLRVKRSILRFVSIVAFREIDYSFGLKAFRCLVDPVAWFKVIYLEYTYSLFEENIKGKGLRSLRRSIIFAFGQIHFILYNIYFYFIIQWYICVYIYVGMRISWFIVRLCLSFSLCIDFGHDVQAASKYVNRYFQVFLTI